LIVNFLRLLIGGINSLIDISFGAIKISDVHVLYVLGSFILLTFFVRLVTINVGRRIFKRMGSGHFIFKKSDPGPARRIFRLIVSGLTVVPLAAFLASLAGVYRDVNNIEYVQTGFRQQIVLFDNSVSAGWESDEPKKTWADLIREGYSELLNLRTGKNDRISLWVFSSNPYLISDFVTNERYLRDKIFKTPHIFIDPKSIYLPGALSSSLLPIPRVIVSGEKMVKIPGEGGTNLAVALDEVTDYLDRKEDERYKHTTFIVVTDGAPDGPVESQLQRLEKKNIRLLVLYIRNSTYDRNLGRSDQFGLEAAQKIENAKKFKLDIVKYGGEFYQANDRAELSRIYRRIDDQETIRFNVKINKDKDDFSDNFLRFGVSVLFFAIAIGLLMLVRKGTSP